MPKPPPQTPPCPSPPLFFLRFPARPIWPLSLATFSGLPLFAHPASRLSFHIFECRIGPGQFANLQVPPLDPFNSPILFSPPMSPTLYFEAFFGLCWVIFHLHPFNLVKVLGFASAHLSQHFVAATCFSPNSELSLPPHACVCLLLFQFPPPT